MLFETLDTTGHEQVIFCHNRDAGLKAIIALHSTRLGPALGGVRMRPYANSEAALNDALRLSRTMTYKNALAGLCLLYTSPSPRDLSTSRMPSSA